MHSLTIELRFFSHLAPNVVKNGQRIVCQRVNRSYLFFDEPEPNGSVQLSFNGIFARQNYTLGGTHKFDFREICLKITTWLIATPIKKLLSKSRRLLNPSRFSVRNFSNPRSCSSSYARPKSASQRDLSQRASNPSSSAEELFSCFFARSTVLLGSWYGNYWVVLLSGVRWNREK